MTTDIRLDNVRLKLGATQFAFDLYLESGVFAAVTGASGAGKTTLFNLIAGFETPDEGRILIGERVMNTLAPAERPVSLIFQEHNLFAHLDVFSNVALGVSPALRFGDDDRARIESSLEQVGLGGFSKRMPGSLSGGERQRVAFARALVRNRPVLLLDEPFAALDPHLRMEMGGLLADLHRRNGTTILMISHDPAEAERLAESILHIDKGQIAG